MKYTWAILILMPFFVHGSYPIYEDDFIPQEKAADSDLDDTGYQALKEKLAQEKSDQSVISNREAAKKDSSRSKFRELRRKSDRPRVTHRDDKSPKILPQIEADAEELEDESIPPQEESAKSSGTGRRGRSESRLRK